MTFLRQGTCHYEYLPARLATSIFAGSSARPARWDDSSEIPGTATPPAKASNGPNRLLGFGQRCVRSFHHIARLSRGRIRHLRDLGKIIHAMFPITRGISPALASYLVIILTRRCVNREH
jgi:hypothetical protein